MAYESIDNKNREYYLEPELNADGVSQTGAPSEIDDELPQTFIPRRHNVSVQTYNADFTDGHSFNQDNRIQDRLSLEGRGYTQNEARGEVQSFWNAMGNAVGNNLAIAGTTFLGNTIGLLANVITGDYDNDFSRWVDERQQRTAAALPIYQKKGYEDMSIWQKMGSQSFWAEQVKSAGFTEGMLLSQALYNAIPGVGAFIAPIASSVGEATTEAIQAKNDKLNAETQVLYDQYNKMLSGAESPEERQELYDGFVSTLSNIERDVDNTGNFVFGLNVGLLSLTNWAAWSALVSPKKAAVQQARSEARKNISREVVDGVGQAGFNEGKHLVLDSKAKAAVKFAGTQIWESTMEGMEEVSQDTFKKTADSVSAFNSFASSDFNPDKRDVNNVSTVGDWISQIIDGYAAEFQDPSWAESFASGFLMRAIGSPMVRSAKAADGSFQSPIFLAGSIHEALGFNSEYNEKQKLVNEVNQMVDDRNLKPLIDMLVQQKGFTDIINDSIELGNELSAQNASWGSLVSLVNGLRKTGHMDILDDIIKESANLSDEQLEALTKDSNGNQIYTIDQVKEGIEKHTKDLRKAIDVIEKSVQVATRTLGARADKHDIENYAINKALESDMSVRSVGLINDILDFIGTIERQYHDGTNLKSAFLDGKKTLAQIMKDAQADNKNIDFVEYAEAEQKLKDSNALQKNIKLLQEENKQILENNQKPQNQQQNTSPAGQQNQQASTKAQSFKDDLSQYTSVKDMKQRILDEFNDVQGLDESEIETALKELADSGNQVAKDFIDFHNYKIQMENEIQGMGLTSQEKQDVKDILDLAFKRGDSLDMFRDRRNPILNDSKTLEGISSNKNDIPVRFKRAQDIILQTIDKTDNSARYRARFGSQSNPAPAPNPAPQNNQQNQGTQVQNSTPAPQQSPSGKNNQTNQNNQQGQTSGTFASIYTNKKGQYSKEDADYIESKGGFALIDKGGVKRGDTIVFAVDQDFSPTKILMIHEKTGTIVGIINSEDAKLKGYTGFTEWAKSVLDDVKGSVAPGTIAKSSMSVKVNEVINGDIIRTSEDKGLNQVIEDRKQDNDGFDTVITFVNKNGDLVSSSGKSIVIRNADEMRQNKGAMYIMCPMPDGTYVGERIFVKHINQNEMDILGKDKDNPFARRLRGVLENMIQASKEADSNAFNQAVSDFKQLVYDYGLHIDMLENGFVINQRQFDENGNEIVDEVFNNETKQVERHYRENHAYFSYEGTVIGELNDDGSVSASFTDPEAELADFLKQLYGLNLMPQITEQDMRNPSRRQEILNDDILTTNSTLRVENSNIKTESVTKAPTTPATNNYKGGQQTQNPVGGQQNAVPGTKVKFEDDEYYADTRSGKVYLPNGKEAIVLDEEAKEEILARADVREKIGQPGAPVLGNNMLLSTGKVYNFREGRFATGAEAQEVIDRFTKPQPAPQPAAQPVTSSLPDAPAFRESNRAGNLDADSQRSSSLGVATFRLTRRLQDGTDLVEMTDAYVEPMTTIVGTDVYFSTIPSRNMRGDIVGYRVVAVMPNGNSFSPGILTNDRIEQEGGMDVYKEKLAKQLAAKPDKVVMMAAEHIFNDSQNTPIPTANIPQKPVPVPEPPADPGARAPRRPPRRLPKLHETSDGIGTQIDFGMEIEWLKKVLPQYSTAEILKIVDNIASDRGTTIHGFYNGINIVLSRQAETGTTYHEAFHVVVDKLLTNEQKDDMFRQARETYGEMSEYDLEERLAEDFRLYVMSNQDYVPETKFRRFFRHLYARIQDMLRIKPSMTQLFYRINSGYYARQEPVRQVESERVQQVSSQTSEYLREIGVSDSEYLSLPKEIQDNLISCAGF